MATPSGTISGAGGGTTYTSGDNLQAAMSAVNTINTQIANGTLTPFTYTGSGNVAPAPASGSGGDFVVSTPTNGSVFVNGADQVIQITSTTGPVSLQGGAAGGTVVGGAGMPGAARNVTYTNITPSGSATDTILITGGNNLIQTATFGTGNYNVGTGSGNDTINILLGNGTVNAGTGTNQINLGTGASSVTSVGYDTITGSSVGGAGVDTVAVTSGQTSINSGQSSFLVSDFSPNGVAVTLGFGVDTVNVVGSAPATVTGISGTKAIEASGSLVGTDTSQGDGTTVLGGAATVTAGAQNDTITSFSGTNLLQAGTGNDTLIAGTGADTLTGGVGTGATDFLVSGTGAGTTFSFTAGKGGASDTISGFKSTDVLSFTGYGGQPQGTAVTQNGSTIITLADSTTITITGVTPAPNQFVAK